jgi:hypothetical protein
MYRVHRMRGAKYLGLLVDGGVTESIDERMPQTRRKSLRPADIQQDVSAQKSKSCTKKPASRVIFIERVSRGGQQLPLITRGIGRRRETRHSVAPRIHALSVHRVVRQPVLRSGVLPADLLHNGRVVVWLRRLLRECGNCDGHGYGRCDGATPTLDIEAHSIISRRLRVAWHAHDAIRRTRAGARRRTRRGFCARCGSTLTCEARGCQLKHISMSANSIAQPNFGQQGRYSLRSTYLGST